MSRFRLGLLVAVVLAGCVKPTTQLPVQVEVTRIVMLTAEPLPSATAYPTLTPWPTYTAYPTYTPYPEAPTPTERPTPAYGTRRNPAKIGDTLEVWQSGNLFEITVVEAVVGQRTLQSHNKQPKEGQEVLWIYAKVRVLDCAEDTAINNQYFDFNWVGLSGEVSSDVEIGGEGSYFGGQVVRDGEVEGWVYILRDIGEPISLVYRITVNLEFDKGNRGDLSGGGWFFIPGQIS